MMRVFYSSDGLIGLREPEWLQGALRVLIGLFLLIGLMKNVAKSKMMACQPWPIRSEILREAVV